MRRSLVLLMLSGAFVPVMVSVGQEPFRIIDMHFHGAAVFGEQEVQPIEPWLKAFDERGVEKAVLSSFPHQLEVWVPRDRRRFIPSLWFPCMTQFVRECFAGGEPLPDPAWVRKEIEAGRITMLGEVRTQLLGIYPSSPELKPYFSLAEEFDIPFALHMGPGPRWAVTDGSVYKEFPDFEIAAGNPLELEEVLRRHPDLRLYVMHAGWPMIHELLTLLWHHPNVYVDLGHLQVAIPRAEYYDYLERIVSAAYGNRVMYGSDVGLDNFGSGIDAILDARFLSEQLKRDILYNNAARFLRLEN